MKTIALFVGSAAAIGLCACNPPADKYGHWGKQAQPMKLASRLDCPEEFKDMKRTSAAPDGRSCVYSGDDDSTVEVKLVNFTGDADATLNGLENEVHALVPVDLTAPATPAAPAAPAAPGAPAAPKAPAQPEKAADVSMHPAGTKLPDGPSSDRDKVDIDLPGLHIHTNGEKARVKAMGVNVDADDDSDTAHVEGGNGFIGKVKVDAHKGGAVVRIDNSDVNIRRRVQFSSDNAGPQGDYTAGYVARGPRSGPVAVAVVRIKKADHDDDIFNDATELLKKFTDR